MPARLKAEFKDTILSVDMIKQLSLEAIKLNKIFNK